MSLFNFLKNPSRSLHVVIDVGSEAIKALVFERSQNSSSSIPRVLKKMIVDTPGGEHGTRTINKLRELLFAIVKNYEKMPAKIIIGFDSAVLDESLVLWNIKFPETKERITRSDLKGYFNNLHSQKKDGMKATLDYPVAILANGYYTNPQVLAESRGISEIAFQVLHLTFQDSIGTSLANMKSSLGGMPIEFIAQIASIKNAVISKFSLKDVFLVKVGISETTLVLIKDDELRGIFSFPSGVWDTKDNNGLWKNEFLKTLDSFYNISYLPEDLFLFGKGANDPEIKSYLSSSGWISSYSYIESPRVRVLQPSAFFGGDSLEGFLQGPEDVGLASMIIYSKEHESIF